MKFLIYDNKKFDYLYIALPEKLVIKLNLINYKEKKTTIFLSHRKSINL